MWYTTGREDFCTMALHLEARAMASFRFRGILNIQSLNELTSCKFLYLR